MQRAKFRIAVLCASFIWVIAIVMVNAFSSYYHVVGGEMVQQPAPPLLVMGITIIATLFSVVLWNWYMQAVKAEQTKRARVQQMLENLSDSELDELRARLESDVDETESLEIPSKRKREY
jgi:cytochrome c-type biogenesis protein CcmH/NrfG